ncbi:branched chain amino acid ABC transporter substrate-binding protein [Clostridia bacterium]|nr:branched chain amino acid ABC transporter substrate-binding protein [Clostridia bacterium]
MTKRLAKLLVVIMVLGLVAMSVAACGGGSSKGGETISIGMALPLTGDSAMYGETVRDGVQFGVDEINAAGGIDGKQIKLVIEDDKGNPQEAAMVAQKLSGDDSLFCVIGHVNSSCTIAGLPIYAENGLTVLNTSSSAEEITQLGYTNFFRTVIHDGLQAPMMVRHSVENLGLTKIATIAANSDYGLGLLSGAKAAADEFGAEIVTEELYVPLSDKDFSVQLAKIKQADPEVLLILGDYNEAGLIIRQMKAAGLDIPVVTPAACSNDAMIELAGAEAAEGVYLLGYWDPDRPEPVVKDFVTKYEDAHDGAIPDERNAYGYEIPYIIKAAIEKGATKETLPEVLRTIDYIGPTGETKFDDKGDVAEKMQMVFVVKDGHFTPWVK